MSSQGFDVVCLYAINTCGQLIIDRDKIYFNGIVAMCKASHLLGKLAESQGRKEIYYCLSYLKHRICVISYSEQFYESVLH